MLSTNKSYVLQVRMTPADRAKLIKLAAIDNIALTEWLRRAIQRGK